MTQKRKRGDFGEDLAQKFLIKKGYQILDRNYLKKLGEIDIIALYEDMIVFVEVKTRKNFKYSYPSEAVDKYKQRKIKNTACIYLEEKGFTDYKIRFDVCEVYLEERKIRFIENAF
ncbi:MAG: YraN family protein [Tissierellia bacterium]|nr:YraN family protein [Tissierellia bacterium]